MHEPSRSRYVAGCRCVGCCDANRDYQQEWWRVHHRGWARKPLPSKASDEWMERGACHARVELTEQFYAERDTTIVAMCEACPVRQPCLQYALAHEITDGIWGGVTGSKRVELLANRRNLETEVERLFAKEPA